MRNKVPDRACVEAHCTCVQQTCVEPSLHGTSVESCVRGTAEEDVFFVVQDKLIYER